jgi:formylglycine-generating enzyme required for sulfatase activity
MNDPKDPPGWVAQQALLKALEGLRAEICDLKLSVLPEINDDHWGERARTLVDVAELVADRHRGGPNPTLPDALAGLRDATRAFRMPRTDPVLDLPTPTTRALRALEGRLRAAVDDVSDAVRAIGIEVKVLPENPVRKRQQEIQSLIQRLNEVDRRAALLDAALEVERTSLADPVFNVGGVKISEKMTIGLPGRLRSFIGRLDKVGVSLTNLEAAQDAPAASNQPHAKSIQSEMIKEAVGDIKIEVSLARYALSVDDETINFAVFSRAVAAVGEISADLVETCRAWETLISRPVRKLAEALNKASRLLTFRTRALARLLIRNADRQNQSASPTNSNMSSPDFPEMILIPAGKFMMGMSEAETERVEDSQYEKFAHPVHEVTIAYAFRMARTLVTRRQFGIFARETGFEDSLWQKPRFHQEDNHPVVNVSARDAEAYLAWLSEKTGREYRLPNEAEWEYAARGGTKTTRYWGNTWDPTKANANRQYNGTTSVGAFPPNAFRLYDMLGNVSEWCADDWQESYDRAPLDGSAFRASNVAERVVRGGGWAADARLVRAATRNFFGTNYRSETVGFRCVQI